MLCSHWLRRTPWGKLSAEKAEMRSENPYLQKLQESVSKKLRKDILLSLPEASNGSDKQ